MRFKFLICLFRTCNWKSSDYAGWRFATPTSIDSKNDQALARKSGWSVFRLFWLAIVALTGFSAAPLPFHINADRCGFKPVNSASIRCGKPISCSLLFRSCFFRSVGTSDGAQRGCDVGAHLQKIRHIRMILGWRTVFSPTGRPERRVCLACCTASSVSSWSLQSRDSCPCRVYTASLDTQR